MSPERWQQVEDLFQKALALGPQERRSFLDQVCATDGELRDEVDRMLAGDEDARGFLESPATDVAARAMAADAARVKTGMRIGPYEMGALIGSGGMGDVYKALDTRLGRTVAVKVLPVSGEGGRRERFLREAQAASALNHPHIVTIYDVVSEGGRDCLVMEHLEGKTLDKVLAGEKLRLREVLQLGIEIADGLAAAHAAGIVHRDIKPGNLMVTAAGSGQRKIKVLDFGLAKQATGRATLTQAGMVMGTVAYMSPEQAEGRSVDARSDIFSFGAVLYEMVTGQAAFEKESGASTMAAILRDEPAPARTLVPAMPRELQWVIALCLKKQPARRWQGMPDLKVALEEALEKLETPEKLGEEQEAPRAARRSWRWGAAVAGLVLAVGAAGIYWGRQTAPSRAPEFQRLTYRRGDLTSAKFAPDGQTIIYSAEWDMEPSTLFSTRVGSREARPLGLPAGKILSFGPAGEMALLLGPSQAFFEPGILSRAPLAGGAPREVMENVVDADWMDATNLAVIRSERAVSRVEFPAGKTVFEIKGRRSPCCLRVSPSGDGVAFFNFDAEAGDYAIVYVPKGGAPKILTRGWRGMGRLAWSPDGSEIWFSAGIPGGEPALRAVTLAGRERILAQTPWMILHDVSRDGRMLAAQVISRISMISGRMSGEAADGRAERDLSWLDTSRVYDVSADGKTLLFGELSYGEGRNPAVFLRKSDGSPAVRLGDCSRPSLSPDGKWVLCIHAAGPASNLMLLPVGAGESRRLPNEGFRYEQAEWLPDGERILFSGTQGTGAIRNYVRALGGGESKPVTAEGMTVSRVSPDGKRAVAMREGDLLLQELETGASRRIGAAMPGESALRWSTDGRALFTAVREGNTAFRVYRVDAASGSRVLLKEIRPRDLVGVTMYGVVVTPDGASYVFSYQRDMSDLYLISGLR